MLLAVIERRHRVRRARVRAAAVSGQIGEAEEMEELQREARWEVRRTAAIARLGHAAGIVSDDALARLMAAEGNAVREILIHD